MAPRQAGSESSARDRLLSGYADSLSDASLLGVLVGESRAGTIDAILDGHPIPDGLWRVTAEDLVCHSGVGPAAAARVLACLELSRRASTWGPSSRPGVHSPEDVTRICAPQLRGLDREHFWSLPLNTKNQLLRVIEVSVGSLNASIVHPRELFKEAIRLSAAALIVVHNHPSGDPTPSAADIRLTKRLIKAGDVLGIEVLDHVVIGDGGCFTSMRDEGLI